MFDNLSIPSISETASNKAQKHLDNLVKPLGSLGHLEEYATKLAGIRGFLGGNLKKRAVLVFAADNGVHSEHITPVPKVVTAVQTQNIADGIAGVSVLCKQFNSNLYVYNVGVEIPLQHKNVIDKSVMPGTNDITKGPAMTKEQCMKAMQVGYDSVIENSGLDIIGIGEMGICNTTTTAAVACVLLGGDPKTFTGFGAGITKEQHNRKIEAINTAIKINRPNKDDIVDTISKVGGLDIAAMTGAYLACAQKQIPVVIDGYISACAALCAIRKDARVLNYMFASHKSFEPGYMLIMEEIGLLPAYDLQMRLGEGSGCPLMFEILESSLNIINNMGTFESGNLDSQDYVDLREE